MPSKATGDWITGAVIETVNAEDHLCIPLATLGITEIDDIRVVMKKLLNVVQEHWNGLEIAERPAGFRPTRSPSIGAGDLKVNLTQSLRYEGWDIDGLVPPQAFPDPE